MDPKIIQCKRLEQQLANVTDALFLLSYNAKTRPALILHQTNLIEQLERLAKESK